MCVFFSNHITLDKTNTYNTASVITFPTDLGSDEQYPSYIPEGEDICSERKAWSDLMCEYFWI